MRHGERDKTQESRLSCQSLKHERLQVEQLGSSSAQPEHRTTARCLLYRLQTSQNQQGVRVRAGEGEGRGFSLSQFNRELRPSGPGQRRGDPSEKD